MILLLVAASCARVPERGSVGSGRSGTELRAAYVAAVQADVPRTYDVYDFRARNAAHGFLVDFGANGPSLRGGDAQWRADLTLSRYGCPGALRPVLPADHTSSRNRVDYRRGHALIEWYLNGPAGLEQGFTLAAAPACSNVGGDVTLEMEVGGDLAPSLVAAGGEVVLLNALRERLLSYTALSVTDAAGRELPARMEVGGSRLRLSFAAADAAYPVTVDPLIVSQQTKLVASDGAEHDNFGWSVSVSGDTAAVGANLTNAESGAVYIFARGGTSWSQQTKLLASDSAAGDRFGHSVSLSGDTAVVGAYRGNSGTGAAYVYVHSGGTWTQQATLLASDGAGGDSFGLSVSLSGDTAVVGAHHKNFQTGAAYVFIDSGATWAQQAELAADDGASGDWFGVGVSLSGDTAVVGAQRENSDTGAAYVFVRSGTIWSPQAKLLSSDGAFGDWFGSSVSVSGDTVVVGAEGKNTHKGAGYVFVRSGTIWSQQAKLIASDGAIADEFGVSVSVSEDTAVVGAIHKNLVTGAAYVFARSGTTWTQQATLLAGDAATYDGFGASVAVAGNTAVVGAPWKSGNIGAAYVFIMARANGDPCATAAECLSGFCVDGTCCTEVCTLACMSCSNAAGACTSFVAAGMEDPNSFPPCTNGMACDGAGSCKKAGGQPCVAASECGSGWCTDGVCCDGPCDGECHSCSLPGHEGTCTQVPDGQDPRRQCQASSDGGGACARTCLRQQCAYPDIRTLCGTCVACDGTGRCAATPADDEACGTITCGGLDTACRSYRDLTFGRCANLGICKAANDPTTCTQWTDLPCQDGGSSHRDAGSSGEDGGGASLRSRGCSCAVGSLAAPVNRVIVPILAAALAPGLRRRLRGPGTGHPRPRATPLTGTD